MTDIKLTEACAEAMGWKHLGAIGSGEAKRDGTDRPYCLSGKNDWWNDPEGRLVCGPCQSIPDPLHDDAQAMALVKKFNLWIAAPVEGIKTWAVTDQSSASNRASNADLNRAIVECVAKMKASVNDPN